MSANLSPLSVQDQNIEYEVTSLELEQSYLDVLIDDLSRVLPKVSEDGRRVIAYAQAALVRRSMKIRDMLGEPDPDTLFTSDAVSHALTQEFLAAAREEEEDWRLKSEKSERDVLTNYDSSLYHSILRFNLGQLQKRINRVKSLNDYLMANPHSDDLPF